MSDHLLQHDGLQREPLTAKEQTAGSQTKEAKTSKKAAMKREIAGSPYEKQLDLMSTPNVCKAVGMFQPVNEDVDGAAILMNREKWMPAIEARLAADRAHLLSVLDARLALLSGEKGVPSFQLEAMSNTLELQKGGASWLRVRIPLWDTENGIGVGEKLGWYLYDSPREQRVAEKSTKGIFAPDSGEVAINVTSIASYGPGACGPPKFERYKDEELAQTVLHEVQHRCDPDTYVDGSDGWENSLIRVRREFRTRIVAGTHPEYSPPLELGDGKDGRVVQTEDLGLKDTLEHWILVEILTQYPAKEDPKKRLLDVYEEDVSFRKACLDFIATYASGSMNLTNSPRLDDLRRLIERHWQGIIIAGQEKPWPELVRRVKTLTPDEQKSIAVSAAWRQSIDEHMVDEEIPRFWSLLDPQAQSGA